MNVSVTTDLWHFGKDKKKEATMKKDITLCVCACVSSCPCMCMCACVCVCVSVCLSVCVYACAHACVCVPKSVLVWQTFSKDHFLVFVCSKICTCLADFLKGPFFGVHLFPNLYLFSGFSGRTIFWW